MKKLLSTLFILVAFALHQEVAAQTNSSLSSAAATIYLDFDGEYVDAPVWNNATPFAAAAASLTASQKEEIFERVAEDYRPFNINITTSEASFLEAPINKRIRVIITSTSAWFPGVGGVAYVGSFTWGDDTPCFVFSDRLGNNTKYIAECCSHESGHTLGLSHQSTYNNSCQLTATYNEGQGTGESGWAPIMGNSYYRNMSGWNNGPTPYGCGNIQDNLSIITSQNGFGYRPDDFSDDINNNPTLINLSSFSMNGVISTSSDKDVFTFTLTDNANVMLTFNPFNVGSSAAGANLDIKVSLYNAARVLIRTYDPANTMSVTIDTLLNSGNYYLMIDGTGNSFVNDYGSLGSYSIEGIASILPIRSVTLTGNSTNNKHDLNWEIQSDAPIQEVVLEQSSNGIAFEPVAQLAANSTHFEQTQIAGNWFYRLKVVSTETNTKYSNTIQLKSSKIENALVQVNTLIAPHIIIRSDNIGVYQLISLGGQVILKGNLTAGLQTINTSLPAGIYILRTKIGNTDQTFKLVKP